jgi:hypothetical protein
MVKRPADSTSATFGECWHTSAGAYRGSITGFMVVKEQVVTVGSGESESEELFIRWHVSRGDGKGIKMGKEDREDNDVALVLEIRVVWIHAWLHVVKGTVLDGWRDSLQGLVVFRFGGTGKTKVSCLCIIYMC